MRVLASIVLAITIAACSSSSNSAEEQAKKQAAELESKGEPPPAQKMVAPVTNEAHIACDQLIQLPAFQAALGEKDSLSLQDDTKADADAAASCSLIKGGKKLTDKEQAALVKKTNMRMGVLPGDTICNVTAYCWTVETQDGFKGRCQQLMKKDPTLKEDNSMGSYTCLKVVAEGEDDVNVYRFFDEDSKCILQVRGGPSNVDNNKILACAKTARDTIGPDQIKATAAAPTP